MKDREGCTRVKEGCRFDRMAERLGGLQEAMASRTGSGPIGVQQAGSGRPVQPDLP